MAIIPLKQTAIIEREVGVDEFNRPTRARFTLKCRLQEGVKLTRSSTTSQGPTQLVSQEVVSSAQFYFDKFADVRVTDTILYTDETGVEKRYQPINVERKRNLAGKAILTIVEV